MRSVLLLLFTFLGLAVVRAEDYAYLTIVGADGGKTSLTAVGLTLSFSDDNLVARNAYTDESLTLPPPTAKMKSTFCSRHRATPFSTSESLGLGTTPPNST